MQVKLEMRVLARYALRQTNHSKLLYSAGGVVARGKSQSLKERIYVGWKLTEIKLLGHESEFQEITSL